MNFIKCCLVPAVLMLLLGIGIAFFVTKDMPAEWNVEVQVSVDAPIEDVHEVVGDFRRWEEWNGFNELYPAPKVEVMAEVPGVGWYLHASSRDYDVRFELTASDASKGVWFQRITDGTLTQESIEYEPTPSGTLVTWRGHGSRGDDIVGRTFNAAIQDSMQGGLQQNLLALQRYLERPR